MSWPGRKQLWRAVALAATLALFSPSLFAQSPTNPPALVRSNPPLPHISLMGLPLGKCPVDFFRQLLAMTPAEQRQSLTNRPLASQKLILAKLREYQVLPPEERELRLRATELRWYLLPLMKSPGTNRLAQLDAIPPGIRTLVADRLKQWDSLAPNTQQQLLRNQATLPRVATILVPPPPLPRNSSQDRQGQVNASLQRLRELTDKQRQKLADRFNDFFKLTPEEQKDTLSMLSEPEQRQLEKTLRDFEKLTPPRRALCLKSFTKFASLSLEERQQFLKSAEQWKLMTPTERQAWKDLVNRMAHLPPVPRLPPPPLPSLPDSPRSPGSVAGTNRN